MSNKIYQPRNNWVLIRQIQEGEIALPDGSVAGYKHIVEAIGSKVEDLTVGDEVLALLLTGDAQNFVPVSQEKGLIATKESNVLLIVREKE